VFQVERAAQVLRDLQKQLQLGRRIVCEQALVQGDGADSFAHHERGFHAAIGCFTYANRYGPICTVSRFRQDDAPFSERYAGR